MKLLSLAIPLKWLLWLFTINVQALGMLGPPWQQLIPVCQTETGALDLLACPEHFTKMFLAGDKP